MRTLNPKRFTNMHQNKNPYAVFLCHKVLHNKRPLTMYQNYRKYTDARFYKCKITEHPTFGIHAASLVLYSTQCFERCPLGLGHTNQASDVHVLVGAVTTQGLAIITCVQVPEPDR